MEYLKQIFPIIISCSTLSKALIAQKTLTVTTKLSELLMNLELMDLWKKIKILTGLYWTRTETVRHILQKFMHYSKQSMMDHLHWPELKCDIEIALPGWQKG